MAGASAYSRHTLHMHVALLQACLAHQLQLLRQQVRLFSSRDHVRALQASGCSMVGRWGGAMS